MAENKGIDSCCLALDVLVVIKKINSQVKDQSLPFSLSETRLAPFVTNLYRGVWPIKCHQGSKTNILNCEFRKKATYDWV
jgi:hypothetical protein